jgi:hypothetical protein
MTKLPGTTLLMLTVFITMCCWASEFASPPTWTSEPLKIIDGYGLAPWSYGGYALIGTLARSGERYAIVSDIVSIGWNNDFILVESKVTKQEWNIIVVSTGKNYSCDQNSPFTEDCSSFEEFNLLKQRIGVPNSLVMKDVDQVYEELSKNK